MKPALATVAVVAALVSCNSDSLQDLVTIGVDVEIPRQTVPGLLRVTSCDTEDPSALIPGLMQAITIDLRDEEELQGEGAVDAFESVVLVQVVLDIVDVPSGDSDNWDFIDSIRLFADDPATPDPPVLVAELDPVPQGITRMVIPGTGVDISDVASAESFVVSAEVSGRVPCDEVNFVGEADFDVELF